LTVQACHSADKLVTSAVSSASVSPRRTSLPVEAGSH